MPAIVNGNELVLTGAVGDDMGWGWGDCFTATDVILALAQMGNTRDIIVRLNSGGGIATEGSAIHSALTRHQGKKTIVVEGIAASAASIIAMAGDEVVMALGAILMIHDPAGFTVGTIVDHEMQIAALTALGDAMASIYAAKSGQSVENCRADMKAEIWLKPEDAIAKGYADRIDGDRQDEPEPVAFNYRMYQHAPAPILALADARQWTKRKPKADVSAANHANQETDMATLKADQTAAGNEQQKIDAAVTAATATSLPRAHAAEIATLCNEGGVPAMAASLLAEGATVEQAKAKINSAGQIKDIVALARRTNPAIPETLAATMLAEGKTVDQARAALFDQLVSKDEAAPLAAHHRAGAGGANQAGGPDAVAAKAKSKENMKAQIAKLNPNKAKEA